MQTFTFDVSHRLSYSFHFVHMRYLRFYNVLLFFAFYGGQRPLVR